MSEIIWDQEREPETEEQAHAAIKETNEMFVQVLMKRGFSSEDAITLWEMSFSAGAWYGFFRCRRALNPFLEGVGEVKEALKKIFPFAFFLFVVGCSDARSSGRPEAERVFTTQAGYVCFLVRDEDGRAVGGNCVRD